MEVDYSPFLHLLDDGSIWWQLTDATRLGAGYVPVRDGDRNLVPKLRAKKNRAIADTRTLISEFAADRYTAAHPRLVERDGVRYVEAHEFLEWLSQYLASQTGPKIDYPNELASAVRNATEKSPRAQSQPEFASLTLALEGHFEKLLSDLPEALRRRVKKEFFPLPWDDLAPEQRRSGALQWDYQRDPATEDEREFWWDFYVREDHLKKQIEHWAGVQAPTASDLALKESRLTELRQELARMERQRRQARGDYYPTERCANGAPSARLDDPAFPYVAYPKVMARFTRAFGSTPEELAAWVWWGPKHGGLAAYLNVNELDPPPRFNFPVGNGDFEYVRYMMACWFKKEDIDRFSPKERYITGQALLERWSSRPGLHAKAFIRAKVAESRLEESHPNFGFTQATDPAMADFPPLETGLFALSYIEHIEKVDFADDADRPDRSLSPDQPVSRAPIRHDSSVRTAPPGEEDPSLSASALDDVDATGNSSVDETGSAAAWAVFLAMTNLGAEEMSIAFVGDKAEEGLGANNMLEISARGEARRIPLAALDLVDRRRGCLNSQGIVLLGLAQKMKVQRTEKNAAKMTRLRRVFSSHLGIAADPFYPYRQGAGWEPRFKIADKRGAADQRAALDAERRTDSYEQLAERGEQFAHRRDRTGPASDLDGDDADEWLKRNDPDMT